MCACPSTSAPPAQLLGPHLTSFLCPHKTPGRHLLPLQFSETEPRDSRVTFPRSHRPDGTAPGSKPRSSQLQRLPTGVFHPSYHCVDIYSIRLSTSVYSHCMSLAPGTVPAWVTLGIRYLLDKSGHVVGSQLDAGNQDLTGFCVQFSWSLPSGEGIR